MKRNKKRRRLVVLTVGLALAACAVALSFYRPFQTSAGGTTPPGGVDPDNPRPDLVSLPGELQTFLVMGVDDVETDSGRADSMMVASYDPEAQRLAMLSIPRDLWTQIPGYGYDKINHAYAYGGHTLAIDTVERLLGIDIDHWVAISFEGFTEVIDALGGVEVNPPKALYYVDPYDWRMGPDGLVIDIEPGEQVMDGLTALKYARFRADEEGDLGRMRRQQEVIKSVIKKAASPAIISRAPQLIPAVYNTLGTDMTVAQLLKLAASGHDALSNPLETGTIQGEAMALDGVFYFSVDLAEARTEAYELLVGEEPDEEFLAQAESDNEAYQAVLEEELARSEAAALAAAQEAAEQAGAEGAEPGENGEGGDPSPTDPNAPGSDTNPGDPGNPSDPTDPNDGTDPADPGEPPADSEPVTVNLVDASGGGIGQAYAEQLAAVGFVVERVSETSARIATTMAVAREELPGAEGQLRSVMPNLIYTFVVDPDAQQSIDLVLGTDLLPPQ